MDTLFTPIRFGAGRVLLSVMLVGLLCTLPGLAQARISLGSLQAQIAELKNEDQAATGQLVIESAYQSKASGHWLIQVSNLGDGVPDVTLAGVPLPVLSVTPDKPAPGVSAIEVFLPTAVMSTEAGSDQVTPPGGTLVTLPVFKPGSYILTVTNGSKRSHFDAFELAIAARENSPQAPRTLGFGNGYTMSKFEDCIIGDVIDCRESATMTFQVPEGAGRIWFETLTTEGVEPNTVVIQRRFTPKQVPRPGRFGYDIEFTVYEAAESHTFSISPDDPVYTSRSDPGWPIADLPVKVVLMKDAMVALTMPIDSVKLITTESIGAIDSAVVQPYTAGATDARLVVGFTNYGSIPTDYITTVTQCSAGIDMVPAQLRTLDPSFRYRSLAFDLHNDSGLDGSMQCTVTLKSTSGLIYHTAVVVNFPAPLAP